MKIVYIFLTIMIILTPVIYGQVTGLSGWDIILDPGHSQKQNMGIFGYSEAEKNLRVGLNLRDLLLQNTDIDTVYMTRTNDQQDVSLGDRTSLANALNTQWFHSIHSNAPSTTSNTTLLLWGQHYNGSEKVPNGGKAMSDIMVDELTAGMRTTTLGSIGDCSFYTWSTWCEQSGGPYLYVNRTTNMPSELSEAGYHTNSRQNQLNMNAEWKRLEAYTFFWSILKFHGLQIPAVGILTGIIKDLENGTALNGATVKVDGKEYTTNTWESLFNKYSSDPEQLRNGFYFIEDLPNESLQVIVSHPDYYSDTLTVLIVDDFFTFKDMGLVSKKPPVVKTTSPVQGDTAFNGYARLEIPFSRPMNTQSVDSAFTATPPILGSFVWFDSDRTLKIFPDSLLFETDYMVIIDSSAMDKYGHHIDGNGDGTGGDDFTLSFRTGPSDLFAPEIEATEPLKNETNTSLQPIISFIYDEILDKQSVSPDLFNLAPISNLQESVTFELRHYIVNNRSIISLFPDEKLQAEESYRTRISPGLRDMLGNETTTTQIYVFVTGNLDDGEIKSIDNFESGSITANWWAPQASGSTTGINAGLTARSENGDFVNLLSLSTTSMALDFGWDTGAGVWLIRTYLGSGAPRNVTFDSTYTMQAWVFGDASGVKLRFAVDDKYPTAAVENHEVSPWIIIDWLGWKLVEWHMGADGTGSWLGDGTLDGTLRFDSIQLTYDPESGAAVSGRLYIDDLKVVKKIPAGIEVEFVASNIPRDLELKQNYPNPFNPETTIEFGLPKSGHVRIEVFDMQGRRCALLMDTFKSAGYHSVHMDGRNFSSGVYFYTVTSGNITLSNKMILIK